MYIFSQQHKVWKWWVKSGEHCKSSTTTNPIGRQDIEKKVYELHLIGCCEIIGPFKDDVLAVTEFEGAVKVTKGDGAKQQVKTF